MSKNERINYSKLHISEIFYYLMLLCLMGAKAIGLTEGQWPFNVALIVGTIFFLCKLAITRYTKAEWAINCLLLLLGVVSFFRNAHTELLFSTFIIIGMKDIQLKRVIGVVVSIWGSFFCVTVVRSLLGIYPGVISTQKKVGMDFGIVRYSLGFTHPNVLHITFFVITLMILFLSPNNKKRIISASAVILFINMYIFTYSMSYTGFLVVIIGVVLNLYFAFRKRITLFEKLVVLLLTAICFMIPIFGKYILPERVFDSINILINDRLKLASNTFSVFAPSLFGNADDIAKYGLNLDSSFAYILFYHGIIIFVLFFTGYMVTLIRSMKRGRGDDVALMMGIAISGVTEQYLGNLSFKNVSLFFIGDCIYNRQGINDASKELDISKLISTKNRIKRYFNGTPYLRCILPSILVAVVSVAIFNNCYEEPKHIYYVDTYKIGTNTYTYNESRFDELEINNSIIVGKIYDGCVLTEEAWVDFRLETIRSRISVLLWSFIVGFVFWAFVFNIKKLNSVYIEDAITDEKHDIPYVPKCSILGTNITVTSMQSMLSYLQTNLNALRGKYICVSNVHTTVTAFENEKYRKIQNDAALALPDGKPLSYVSRKRGFLQADRVAGPDLMEHIFKVSSRFGYRHFFFGSTQETLNRLRQQLETKYPGIEIAGMLSPNYYKTIDEIPVEEDELHIKAINEAHPDFIWVGLGAPKQEIWMSKHTEMFNGVMLGVGAGFDFHAGTIKRAPKVLQALYLEWLYRIFQDPKRLIKRYLSTNLKFVLEVIKETKANKRSAKESDKKRILIYAHYYSPDVASTGQILTELAEGLKSVFDVTVIAAVPSYNGVIADKYKKYRYYQQNVNGVQVYRVRVPEFTKTNKISRAKNILTYFVRAKKLTSKVENQDYVFSISQPPILGGILGTYGKKKKKAKFIYNIQDFNPEQIQSVGYSNSRFLINVLKAVDMRSCSKADKIVTVGEDLANTIEKRFKGKEVPPYCVINNWINEKEVYPLEDNNENVIRFKKMYGLDNKFVFMYSGNIGLYYDLENLLEVFEKVPKDLKSYDGRKIVFAFVGDGGVKEKLQKYVIEHELNNIIFIPYQEKSELIYSLNACDVHICVNAKGIKGVSCPSKYYGIAAAGKPVLGILESGTEIRNIIEKTQSGLVYTPGDYEGIEKAVIIMSKEMQPEKLKIMGQRGRDYLVENLTKDISVNKYIDTISSL